MTSPDIAARTAPFLRACLDCMGGNLVGVYLHGSAAMGCFHPARSDLDYLVVLRDEPADPVKRRFLDRVVELHRAGPAKGIEMSAVTEPVCRHFVYPTPFVLHFSAAHLEAYQADPADYLLRMRGADPTWPPILRSPGSGVRSCSAPPSGTFSPRCRTPPTGTASGWTFRTPLPASRRSRCT